MSLGQKSNVVRLAAWSGDGTAALSVCSGLVTVLPAMNEDDKS